MFTMQRATAKNNRRSCDARRHVANIGIAPARGIPTPLLVSLTLTPSFRRYAVLMADPARGGVVALRGREAVAALQSAARAGDLAGERAAAAALGDCLGEAFVLLGADLKVLSRPSPPFLPCFASSLRLSRHSLASSTVSVGR